MTPNKNLFEIVKTTLGVTSIRNNKVNETMHAPLGPWQEANELYIEQSHLRDHLSQNTTEEFVIYDVGLGAAANALAALHCAKDHDRPIRVVSFEIDLRLLEFALEHSHEFDHFTGFESAIETVLKDRFWNEGSVAWELLEGDFLKTIDQATHKCHLIYYDPYSPHQNKDMWTTHCFKKLKQKCHENACFYNYSQATPIRAALLEAGFFVGYGKPIGEKETTTQAACRLEDLDRPLDQRWLDRWKRSDTPLPHLCENPEALKRSVLNHPQFQ